MPRLCTWNASVASLCICCWLLYGCVMHCGLYAVLVHAEQDASVRFFTCGITISWQPGIGVIIADFCNILAKVCHVVAGGATEWR
jgi:hypothetical protein